MEKNLTRLLREAKKNQIAQKLIADIGLFGPAPMRDLCFTYGASPNTIFDLASLTKILSTSLLTAFAIDLNRLSLDECPWPMWPHVSVQHVMTHTSGLPAWLPLYQSAVGKGLIGSPAACFEMKQATYAVKPVHPAGHSTLYSDIGFIALGFLLEERLGDSLDRIFHDVAQRYYGPSHLCYVPLLEQPHHPQKNKVASTVICPWRKKRLQGVVHDDNAYALGGVAGHAGLFGSVLDVQRAAQFFLEAITGSQLGVPGIMRAFARHKGPRAIGFDRAEENGSTGGALSPHAVGHLGFTGTSLWLDPCFAPNQAAWFILLSNRIYYDLNPEKIKMLRIRFHTEAAAILRAL